MYLTFDATGVASVNEYSNKLDLTGIMDNDDTVVDATTLYTSIVMRLSKWAHEKGADFDDIFPLYIHDGEYWDDTCEKIDAGPDDWGWMKEVAQFAWAAEQEPCIDSDQLFGVVNDTGWKWFNFDDIESSLSEDYHGEFVGDYEDFGKEWESNYSDSHIPDHLYNHIDWDSYGRELVESHNEIEWNDRTFLYSQ
jgi:hypothetical protein